MIRYLTLLPVLSLLRIDHFKVGDCVETDGISGVAEGVQIFSTALITGDNKSIIVPYSAITGSTSTNYPTNDTHRVERVFGMDYGDVIATVKNSLRKIINEDEHTIKTQRR